MLTARMDLWNLPIEIQQRILDQAYPHPLTRAAAQERRPLLIESRRLLRYNPDNARGANTFMMASLDEGRDALRQHWRWPLPSVFREIKLSMKTVYELILRMYNTAVTSILWPEGGGGMRKIGPMYGPGLSRPDGLDHNRRGPAWHRPSYNQYRRLDFTRTRQLGYERAPELD